MATKIKKWLIRKSQYIKNLSRIKIIFLIISLIIAISTLFINYEMLTVKIWITIIILFIIAVIIELIEDFLDCISRNKEIILQNKMHNVLLSDQRFIEEYFDILVMWPIIWLCIYMLGNIPEKNLGISVVMIIILYISLFILRVKLSEKISEIFKQKLS